jgi:hypothetical protein
MRSTNSNGEFITKWMQFAIYLHAADGLPYSRTEIDSSGRSWFVFSDKDRLARHLELEFNAGALVPATALFASQTFIRREMSDAKTQGDQTNVSSQPVSRS